MAKEREYAIQVVCRHGKAKLLMGAEEEEILESSLTLIQALRKGCSIERVTVEAARKTPFGCNECRTFESETTIEELEATCCVSERL